MNNTRVGTAPTLHLVAATGFPIGMHVTTVDFNSTTLGTIVRQYVLKSGETTTSYPETIVPNDRSNAYWSLIQVADATLSSVNVTNIGGSVVISTVLSTVQTSLLSTFTGNLAPTEGNSLSGIIWNASSGNAAWRGITISEIDMDVIGRCTLEIVECTPSSSFVKTHYLTNIMNDVTVNDNDAFTIMKESLNNMLLTKVDHISSTGGQGSISYNVIGTIIP